MVISRIVDIHLFFKSGGLLSEDYYNEFTLLSKDNTAFYSTLSKVIESKRWHGIAKTTIDEFLIPKEMWDLGIWEKSIVIHGTALYEESPENLSAVGIEFTVHTGCNTSPFSGRNVECDSAHKIMKICNIDIAIDCNTIALKDVE